MLERLARRELGPGELIDALRHLDECATCAARASQLTQMDDDALRALSTAEAHDHLDFDAQLVPFVEQRLDAADLEIVESHLEDCAMCRAEVDDLRELHESMVETPKDRWGWLAVAAALAILSLLAILALMGRGPAPKTAPDVVKVVPAPPPEPTTSPEVKPPRYANAEWDRVVKNAIQARALPFPDLRDLSPPPDELRGTSGPADSGLRPAGVVVREPRPQFTWPARENATYVVSVFANDEEVARSRTLREPRWTAPNDLKRGVTYVWQVKIEQGGATETIPAPPAPPAMFRIADAVSEEAIRVAMKEHPDDHLLHAVLFARAGLRDDADRALALAKSAGDDRASTIP